uniref:Uncharacterized protein n=1 Tax=Arundo donax TaxID=35708 RepID=A0A0A9EWF3_ARUDO
MQPCASYRLATKL